ncbi:MAG: hypothetical protein ACJ0Q3_03810 [Candidatus Azotimanducaceae bacterium]
MKLLKVVGYLFVGYVSLVFLFEAVFLGIFQPTIESERLKNLVMTTTDSAGHPDPRRITYVMVDQSIYVSAHHWPRAWYHQAIKDPNIVVELNDSKSDYLAVPIAGREFEAVAEAFPLPFVVRFLMGFPPQRNILRLDPQQ